MAIDISRLGKEAQKQILRKIREQEAKRAEKAASENVANTVRRCDAGEDGGLMLAYIRDSSSSAPAEKKNKLNAVKTDGYASKKEAERAAELRWLQRAGKIRDLREQVEYVLIEPKYEEIPRIGKRGKPIKPKRVCVERGLKYVADYVYVDCKTGETVVEDTKGYINTSAATYKLFVLKRKMMLEKYGIKVVEV